MNRATRAASVALFAAVAGCGDGNPTTYPINGKLEYTDGSPVEAATVTFDLPTPDGAHVGAQGMVQRDGRFQLTTYKPNDGALPGEHRVTVTQPPAGDAGGAVTIPPKYGSPEFSGLKATVTPETKELTLQIERPGKKGAK